MTAGDLAARLRQAVQGCTIHIHGPVQAWAAVESAVFAGHTTRQEVATVAIAASFRRLAELQTMGVPADDPRRVKELLTAQFIRALLGHEAADVVPPPLPPVMTPVNQPAHDRMAELRDAVSGHLDAVANHRMWSALTTQAAVRVFMEHHVYAVWDFMSLLKSLQRLTTCVDVPWVPKGTPETRRLINEIVIGEESDVTSPGQVESHFEMYLRAMAEAGANVEPVKAFVKSVREGHLIHTALQKANVPAPAQEFVLSTLDLINVGRPHAICASFTIGREAAIPGMFLAGVRALPVEVPVLKQYLERHIEVDSQEHSGLAMRMLSAFCGEDVARWHEATGAAIASLQARRRLWDAVVEKLG